MKLIFATRPSALARWQTRWVINALGPIYPDLSCEEKVISTRGDRILDTPLPEIGGKGLFTLDLESELRAGSVHCAVHSLKDLPVEEPEGLVLACIPVRGEVGDVLVSKHRLGLRDLPRHARVGTSSLRRGAQLKAARPDLQIVPLRGNVDTRVRKAREGEYDAIILAGAGLTRLRLEDEITEWLDLDLMLPAPGQGALAVQCRAGDETTRGLLAALDDASTRSTVTAERAFLSGLGGGCAVPVAAHAAMVVGRDEPLIELTGRVLSVDGERAIRVRGQGAAAQALGIELAEQALAQGADAILGPRGVK